MPEPGSFLPLEWQVHGGDSHPYQQLSAAGIRADTGSLLLTGSNTEGLA